MEKNRFYLVNLNADPAMNELLVYYINVRIHHSDDICTTILAYLYLNDDLATFTADVENP